MIDIQIFKNYSRTILDEPSYLKWVEPLKLIGILDNMVFLGAPDSKAVTWLKTNIFEKLNDFSFSNFNHFLKIVPLSDEDNNITIGDSSKFPSSSSNLIKKYSFDSFVQCDQNRIAFSFAYSVSEFPGKSYNPLYIYSDVGLGKTHLMHAIGNRILINNPKINIIYLTTNDFMNEFVEYMRFNKRSEFIKKYTSIDVFLVDDIQYITKWGGTSEQFYYIFNSLIQQEKQIVMCSDKHPDNIPDLEKRIKSRFEMGGIADILPYDLETRIAILKEKLKDRKKMVSNDFDIPDDVLYFLASSIKDNVRKLEGALNRLLGYADLKHVNHKENPITLTFAKEALKPFINLDKKHISIESVQEFIADKYSISIDDLKSKNNSPRVALPRQISMYLIKKMTKFPLSEIGKKFGGKHHTTVLHSLEKIENMILSNEDFSRKLDSYVEYFQE
jgi:chromosomal replication initiator protein